MKPRRGERYHSPGFQSRVKGNFPLENPVGVTEIIGIPWCTWPCRSPRVETLGYEFGRADGTENVYIRPAPRVETLGYKIGRADGT